MKKYKALSWAADLNAEITECERLLQECSKSNIQVVNKRAEMLKLGEDVWNILASDSEKSEFNNVASVKKERKEIAGLKPRVEAIEAEFKKKEISQEYCQLIVNVRSKNNEDRQALLKYAESNKTGSKRAAYFAAYVCSELPLAKKIVLLEKASLHEQIDRVFLRRAQIRKDYVKEYREERINRAIIDSREKYYAEAKENYYRVLNGVYEKYARAEIKELENWHTEWTTTNVITRPTQASTQRQSNDNGTTISPIIAEFKDRMVWVNWGVVIIVVLIILNLAGNKLAEIIDNLGKASVNDTYVETIYEDGTKTKANYIVEDGVLVEISDFDATKLAIPEEVNGQKITAINGVGLYSDEYEVEEISIPEGVTWIENSFRDMPGLKKVILPSTLKELRDYTFADSNNLEEIVFQPDIQMEYVANEVLTNTIWYSKQVMEHGYVLAGNLLLTKDPFAEEVYIPEGATAINAEVFFRDQTLKSITIPDGVRIIGARAFAESSIETVVFEGDLECIGESAFAETPLSSVTFKGSVKEIAKKGFERCQSLPELNLPEGLEVIGDSAFVYCNGVNHIVLPDGLKEIGAEAFAVYFVDPPIGQERLVIPEGVETIGVAAFTGRRAEVVEIPSTIQSIGEGGLGEIGNIRDEGGMQMIGDVLVRYTGEEKNVVIPEGITVIMGAAFRGNGNIVSVSIPEGVKNISEGMFDGCNSLQQVKLPESLESIGECAFNACISLPFIDIPSGVTKIGYKAFGYCDQLNLIEGGEGLKEVDECAFEGTNVPSAFQEKLNQLWGIEEEQ